MTAIVEFSLPAHEFALSETLNRRPGMEFEVDRVVAHDTDHVVPFIRATRGEFEGLTEILESDPSVEEVDLLAKPDGEHFYRMVWTKKAEIVGYMVAEQGATVQEATAGDGQWHLRVLFSDRSGIAATDTYARETRGVTFNIERIYGIGTLSRARHNLTDEQYEVLVEGAKCGYYDVPRGVTIDELADEFGISHQALSKRIRRATKNLVESALLVEEDDDGEWDDEN